MRSQPKRRCLVARRRMGHLKHGGHQLPLGRAAAASGGVRRGPGGALDRSAVRLRQSAPPTWPRACSSPPCEPRCSARAPRQRPDRAVFEETRVSFYEIDRDSPSTTPSTPLYMLADGAAQTGKVQARDWLTTIYAARRRSKRLLTSCVPVPIDDPEHAQRIAVAFLGGCALRAVGLHGPQGQSAVRGSRPRACPRQKPRRKGKTT